MQAATRLPLENFRVSMMVCVVAVFCATTAITSHAQTLTTLARFSRPNAAVPSAPVVQGSDGNFYGTTLFGGANNEGAVYKLSPSGRLTKSTFLTRMIISKMVR